MTGPLNFPFVLNTKELEESTDYADGVNQRLQRLDREAKARDRDAQFGRRMTALDRLNQQIPVLPGWPKPQGETRVVEDRPIGYMAEQPNPAGGPEPQDKFPSDKPGDQQTGQLRAVVELNAESSPDEEAETRRLGKLLGTAPQVIRDLGSEAVSRLKQFTLIDQQTQDTPQLRQKYADEQFARLAADDSEKLSGIERVFRALGTKLKYSQDPGSTTLRAVANTPQALVSSAGAFAEQTAGVAEGASDLVDEYLRSPKSGALASIVGATPEEAAQIAKQGRTDIPEQDPNAALPRVSAWLEGVRKSSKAFKEDMTPEAQSTFEAGIYSGMQSLGATAPWLIAGIATGQPEVAILGMTAGTGGEAYGRGKDAGLGVVESAEFAAREAAVEFLTERLPFSYLIEDIATKSPFGETVIKNMLREQPGEQVATALQDANEWLTLNPEKTFGEYLAERPNAALQTAVATAVASVGQAGAIKLTETAVEKFQREDEQDEALLKQATLKLDALDEVVAAASGSKTLERDPAEIEKFVDELAADSPLGQSVYIAPQAFAQAAAEAGLTPNELATQLEVADQVETSLASGADIAVPTGKYVAYVAGHDQKQFFQEHVKTSPVGLSREEIKQLPVEQKGKVLLQAAKLMLQVEKDKTFAEGMEVVRADLEQQLETAGRFVGEPNRLYAQLAANGYGALATRLNISPVEAFERYPLSIIAEKLTGGAYGQRTNNGSGAERAPDGQTTEALSQEPGFALLDADPSLKIAAIAEQLGVSPRQASLVRKAWKESRGVANNKNAEGRPHFAKLDQGAGNRGEYTPATGEKSAQLGLLRSADLSTFLHEIGHHFLEVNVSAATAILARQRASETLTAGEQELLDDTQELLKQLKIAPGAAGEGQGSFAQNGTLWALEFYETYEPLATEENIKALYAKLWNKFQQDLSARVPDLQPPSIRLFKTSKGRVIAFDGRYTHAEARQLLGDQGLPDADLKMQHARWERGFSLKSQNWYDQSGHLDDYANKLAQVNTSSFKAIREASPEDLQHWYDENVEEVALTNNARQLRLKSSPDVAQPDIRITLKPHTKEGAKFTGHLVDMMFQGRLNRFTEGKPTPEEVKNAFRAFYKTIAALQAYASRTQPEFLYFVGSGDAQIKLYDSILRNFSLGYEARIDRFLESITNRETGAAERDALATSFLLIRPDIATDFALELSNAIADEYFDPVRGVDIIQKRARQIEIVQPGDPARFSGAADAGGTGGSAPAAGVLYQSQTRRPEAVSDEELARASRDLSDKELQIWKAAKRGLSNAAIADELNSVEDDAELDENGVKVVIARLRDKGYPIERAPTNSLGSDALRAIQMLATGAKPADVAAQLGKTSNHIRQLAFRHKNLIEQYRAHRSGKLAQGPIFYSALKRAVETSKQAKASAAQWKATLRNTPGVKAEEIEWTGLFDWLDAQDGPVDRDAVVEFLDANGVKVEEVKLDGNAPLAPSYQLRAVEVKLQEIADRYDGSENLNDYSAEDRASAEALHDQQDALNEQIESQTRMTQFETWVLPGGEDYTELLLTLPNVQGPATHWDEPNVVAHARFKTRRGPNGEKVLAIEEIQSDWHQKGREQGYQKQADPAVVAETRAALDESNKAEEAALANLRAVIAPFAEIDNVAKTAVSDQALAMYLADHAAPYKSPLQGEEKASVKAALLAYEEAQLKSNEAEQKWINAERTDGIPRAPFANNGWAALVLKRVVRWAAENGFDSVAWIPGTVKNGNLVADDRATAIRLRDDGTFVYRDKDGDWLKHPHYTEDKDQEDGMNLANVVGKQAATQLSAEEFDVYGDKTVEGDFTIHMQPGWEFYDQIVVNEANKLGKKYGASLQDQALGTGTNSAYKDSDFGVEHRGDTWVITMDRSRAPGTAPYYDEASAREDLAKLIKQRNPSVAFHSLPITPELKAAALEGLPLFQNGEQQQPTKPLPPGETPLDVWNALSFNERVKFHEEFARLTEAYFMEGKAPTSKLKRMFETFSRWMKTVYQSIQQLGVQLSPEVTSILDRMYAAGQDIEQAQRQAALAPMFTVKPEFMTDDEWADYQLTNSNAVDDAEATLQQRSLRDMKWLSNARSKALRRLQGEAREQRKAIRAEVTAEVMREKVNRARTFLSRGLDENGDQVPDKITSVDPEGAIVEGVPKLSITALELMFPEGSTVDWSKLGYGKYGMLSKDGLHPDAMAPLLGYESGEQLVRTLLTAEPAKEKISGVTDQRMLERYGDLADDNSIARAADEAVHSQLRAKVLASEYAALTNALGERKLINEAAQDAARRLVLRMPVMKLSPAKFQAAERRAGRAAEEAVRKNDLPGAAAAKRDQILNFYLAREVMTNQKDRDAAIGLFRRILMAKKEAIAKSRNFDLVQAARAVLSAHGMARMKNQPIEYMDAIKRYDPRLYDALAPTLVMALNANKKLADLNVDQFLGMRDVVTQLWDLSREEKLVEINGQKVELAQVTGALNQRLEDLGADAAGIATEAPSEWEKKLRGFEGWGASLRRVEAWARRMDGGAVGPFTRYLWRPISQAGDRYRTAKTELLTRYRQLFEAIEPSLRTGKIAAGELGYTFRDKAELLHALLHTGNDSNQRKLLLGRRWGVEDINGNLSTAKWDTFVARMIQEGVLTQADYQFVQSVWDLLESTKPAAQEAHRRVFGRYFGEVTARPIQTPFGEFAGGYVPAIYDKFLSPDAVLHAEQNQVEINDSNMFPTPAHGFTQARVDYNKPLELDLRLLAQHLDKVMKFAHMAAPVRDVLRILSTEGFKRLLADHHPTAQSDMLRPWLQRAANQVVEFPLSGQGGKMVGQVLREIRRRSGMGLMFANIVNTAQQVTGFSLAALRVRKRYLALGLARYIRNPGQLREAIDRLSPMMADRGDNQSSAMWGEINELIQNNKLEQAQAFFARHTYFMQTAVQNVLDAVVWQGAYEQAKEKGETEAEAASQADAAVRQTQGSTLPEDVSRIESGQAWWRIFNMMYGYFNMWGNLLSTEFRSTVQEQGLKKGAGRMLYVYIAGIAVPMIVGQLIADAFRGDLPEDDEEDGYLNDWLEWFALTNVKTAAAFIPVGGQAAVATVNAFNDKPYDDRVGSSPAISVVETSVRSVKSVYDVIIGEGDASRAAKDTLSVLTLLTGLPFQVLSRPVGYAIDVAEGDKSPADTADYVRGLIAGR